MSRATAPTVDPPLPPAPTTSAASVVPPRPARGPARGPERRLGACVALGPAALTALLAALGTTAGLGRAGWAAGLGCGAVLAVALARGLSGAGRAALGPADLVTLSRALLACGVAALAVESLLGRPVTPALLVLTVPALVLDAVDGRVARRTGTVTAFGGRFDGEVDAFLILVLSVAVASSVGWWVLAAGLARYAFAVAGWGLPWLRARLEFRYWRKVVTATVGIVLTVAAADVLPRGVTLTVVVVAVAMLAESFGRDVWWLWRRRPRAAGGPGRATPRRVVGGAAATVLAIALVWFALVAPIRPDRITPLTVLRLPVEAVVVAALVLLVPARATRALTTLVGVFLAVVTLLKVLDLGAFVVLDRPFGLVTDRGQLGSGVAFLGDSLGAWAAVAGVVASLALVAAVVVGLPWAVHRLASLAARHRGRSAGTVLALAVVWVVCAVSGLQVAPGAPVAAADTGSFVAETVRATAAALRDRERFDRAIAADPFRDAATGDLSALRGKDVLLVFVESYGRVAVEGPGSAPVRELLDAGTARLRAAGFGARSAFLSSSTFGGSSWLAHATVQSGLSVSDQGRYDRLLSSGRTTLTSAFDRAGWRTVALLPSTRGEWPEGQAFYGFDDVYGRSGLGYAGPTFGFSAMPDQFALAAFERLELGVPTRPRVMAAIELTSSHGPWAPLPTTVDPAALGDGSVFHGIRADAVSAAQLWSERERVPAAYRTSIAYSLTSVISFVERHGDDDLVLVVLGDHQPSTVVSGFGGNRDVPVTVVARDPHVVEQTAGWGWQEGLRPDEEAPVWPMESFRDHFLTTYSSQPPPAPSVVRP